MPNIFVTRQIPEPGLDLLRQVGQVKVWPEELPPSRDTLWFHYLQIKLMGNCWIKLPSLR